MKYASRYVLILMIGVFIGAGITLERAVQAKRDQDKETLSPLPLTELRTLTEVFNRIKTDYVEEVTDKKIINDAIHGMLSKLDPHSAYLDKTSYREMRIGTEGQFGGLGIEVTMENGFVKVISPIEDTPAARAGLKSGDLIVKLDEKPVKGMTLSDAVKIMRGKVGSKINLLVVREGFNKPKEFTITRAVIKIKSVKYRLLEPGYGYIRITQFQANSPKNMVSAIAKVKAENRGKLKGMVLDLRNNPGGVLPAAVAISDAFITSGLIVYTEGRSADAKLKYSATPSDVLGGIPLVVLVNGSASASEIVAGALQDHKRAVILGTKTFGKGSVQTILPMSGGTALKLTTARYYTPKGRSIQAEGIIPDIIVEEAKVTKANNGTRVREQDLTGHLENEKANKNAVKKSKKKKNQKKDDATDYQLNEALNLLKGIAIFAGK